MNSYDFSKLLDEIYSGIFSFQLVQRGNEPKYLKKVNGEKYHYVLDLSKEDLSKNQQMALIRSLMKDNKRNPTTGILACVKIKLRKKEKAELHPWLRELEKVSNHIANNKQLQQQKADYLDAYFSKLLWTALPSGVSIFLLGIILISISILLLTSTLPMLLAGTFLSLSSAFFLMIYSSGLPAVFENLLNKWVDKTSNDIATSFREAVLVHTLDPLANVENKQPIELGKIELNSQSYRFVLQSVASKKPKRPSAVKLQLIGDNLEEIKKVEQYDFKWLPLLFPKNPQGYYHRENDNFELRADGNVVPIIA